MDLMANLTPSWRWPSLKPIPSLVATVARTERVSTYIELELLELLEDYAKLGGFRSVSEVIRRLVIIGLLTESGQYAA